MLGMGSGTQIQGCLLGPVERAIAGKEAYGWRADGKSRGLWEERLWPLALGVLTTGSGQAWPEKAAKEGRPSAEPRASVPTLPSLILPEGSSCRELLESHHMPPPGPPMLSFCTKEGTWRER